MNQTTLRLACAALGLCAAACGGDESDYETQTNPQYAALAVTQIAGIGSSVDQANPDGSASGVLSLGNVAQNIITPVIEEQQLRRPPVVLPLVGDCTCDAGGCRFDGCSADDGSWTIDGSIDVSGDTYVFDVSMTQTLESDSITTVNELTTSGEITIGDTLIDGHLSGELDTDISVTDEDGTTHVAAWFDWGLTAVEIGLDANRCAVSGSVDASVSAEAESGGRDVDYNGSGTVTLGPACGDATVAP